MLHKNSRVNWGSNNNLTANYIQVADIDLSSFADWEPIGKKGDPFTGTYSGNGHTISNLQIADTSESYIGLFGYVQNGNISNISLTNADISINKPGRQLNIGAICGVMNNSTISDCTVSGIINIISTNYRTVASGIVGTITNSEFASVKRCKNYASVNVEVGAVPTCYAAGICGFLNPSNKSNVIISSCSNYGDISSYSPENMCYAAGICAYTSSYDGSIINIEKCSNHGDCTTLLGNQGYSAGITAYCDAFQDNSCTYVCNCYNSGKIIGRTVGGIGGRAFIGTVSGYSIGRKVLFSNCYNVGSVSASEGLSVTTFVGSMIGSNYNCSIESCYYLDSLETSSDGTALSSSQLQNASDLDGFDFNSVWEYSTTSYLYPVFKSDSLENDDESTVVSGQCGDNAYWSLSTDGILTISGTGSLYGYSSYSNLGGEDYTTAPWWVLKERIKKVVVKGGITRITEYAFMQMHYVEEILFEDGIKTIDSFNFCCNNALTKITIPKSVTGIGKLCCWKGSTNSELTIYGYSGSYAETFAKKNNLKFVDLTAVENPIEIDIQFLDEDNNQIDKIEYKKGIWIQKPTKLKVFIDNNTNTEYNNISIFNSPWIKGVSNDIVIYANSQKTLEYEIDLNGVSDSNKPYAGQALYFDLTILNDVDDVDVAKKVAKLKCESDVFNVINGEYDTKEENGDVLSRELLTTYLYVDNQAFSSWYEKHHSLQGGTCYGFSSTLSTLRYDNGINRYFSANNEIKNISDITKSTKFGEITFKDLIRLMHTTQFTVLILSISLDTFSPQNPKALANHLFEMDICSISASPNQAAETSDS